VVDDPHKLQALLKGSDAAENVTTQSRKNFGSGAALPKLGPRNVDTASLSSRRALSIHYFNNYVDRKTVTNRTRTGAATSRN